MTLRKEITDLLYQYLVSLTKNEIIKEPDLIKMDKNQLTQYVKQDYEYWSNRFIKLFENLIDEKIKELRPYGKTGDSHGISLLEELKKELKEK